MHPLPPPRICFHPCHTKVLICSALTCFTGCLFAGKQARYSFLHCHNLSFQLGIECRCVCPHWTGMLIPSNYFNPFYLCGGVCGSVPLGRASLACLGCPCFGWPVPVRFSCGFLFLVLRGSSLSLLLLGVLLWLLSFWWLPLWLGACGLARSFLFPPSPPPWLSPGGFWSSQCSAGPSLRIFGCICNGPVVIPLVWRVVVDRLLSSLRSLASKASALCGALPSTPCCGCCSCAPRSVTEVFALV